jgi:hypothetical protein
MDQAAAPKLDTSPAQTSRPEAAAEIAAVDLSPTQSLELPGDLLAAAIVSASATNHQPAPSAPMPSTSAATEEEDLLLPSELMLVTLASDTARNKAASTPVATSTSKPLDTSLAAVAATAAEAAPTLAVASASQPASTPVAAAESAPTPAHASSGHDFSELALMATGQWQAMQRSDEKPATNQQSAKSDELTGPEALSLITKPAPEVEPAPEPTVQLALLPDPQIEPKRAANGE